MFTEIVFLATGYVLGVFNEHVTDILRGVWKCQWREVWEGMKNTKRYYLVLFIALAVLLSGAWFYDRAQRLNEVEDNAVMVQRITDTIIARLDQRDSALLDMRQDNREIIERLDRLIEIMEANNATE